MCNEQALETVSDLRDLGGVSGGTGVCKESLLPPKLEADSFFRFVGGLMYAGISHASTFRLVKESLPQESTSCSWRV